MKENNEFPPSAENDPSLQKIARSAWPVISPENKEKGREGERRQPEGWEREVMDKRVHALGKLMKDAPFWWELDGSLNISALKGEYIGAHADVDVSFLREDIPMVESYLKERGYGLFLYKKGDNGEVIFKRVSGDGFMRDDNWEWQLRVASIDENGTLVPNAELFTIDTAVVEKDKDGNSVDKFGVVLPERWLETKNAEFKGETLRLSHPANFVYFKLPFARRGLYHKNDLRLFAELGVLTEQDLDEDEVAFDSLMQKFREQTERAGNNEEERKNDDRIATDIKSVLGELRGWITEAEQ